MMDEGRLLRVNIEEQMKSAYIDYSMSVIVSRALPDVRDGLKPVHRRVLYGMNELGNTSDKPYKKSARIVGEVMGKYHPHGDSSIYGTLVRLAQPWAMRYLLVDGQGNFGSVDGDEAAAMRYTEARLMKLAEEMLKDIDKNTVNFQSNFDETLKEPSVLPAGLPNLLINGASGIAVGMATNMAPHNLSESIDAIVAYIHNNEITIDELMEYIKAPDFPTGGTIYGYDGVKDAFHTGRGRIVIRSKCDIETDSKGHEKIVITEIPYMVNRADLIKAIASLVEDKKVEGISNVNDESDRNGLRVVVDIKRDANANVILNKLYKYSQLESSFSVNNVALVHGRPQTLNLYDLISNFVNHRHEVVTRRTQFELDKALDRAELLEGLMIILDNLDEAIQIIRDSQTPSEAQERLIARFELTVRQASYVVELRLRQLTSMEQDKLRSEYEDLLNKIEDLRDILSKVERRMKIIEDELLALKECFGDERRTDIIYASEDMNPEDFYSDDEMIITLSHHGYIKRTPLVEFRTQNRGGVGSRGGTTKDEDFIEYIYSASMHNYLLFFTQKGKCYWLKVYDLPEGSKNSKGRAIQNMLNIEGDDKINALIKVKNLKDPEFNENHFLVFSTKNGMIKKTCLEAYSRPRQNGVNAIDIREDDKVIQVSLTNGDCEIVIANKEGRAIRFHESKVRETGRNTMGVKAMTIDTKSGDEVIGMVVVADKTETILVVSEQGYGKRSMLDELDEDGNVVLDENGNPVSIYRITNRGGKGVKTMNITDKTGKLVAIKLVADDDNIMIINKSGMTIRMNVSDLRVMGRATQGVRVINLKGNDEIASVCKVTAETEDDGIIDENDGDNNLETNIEDMESKV